MKKPKYTSSFTFILLALISIIILGKFVDLAPHIDSNFFFGPDDPVMESERIISETFGGSSSNAIIISAAGDIYSPEYQKKLKRFSNNLESIEGISTVMSLSGFKDLKKVIKSPIWSRLLLSHDRKSSLLLAVIDEKETAKALIRIEDLAGKLSEEDFLLNISGFPYVVKLIGEYLVKDIILFTSLAFIVFGLVILVIFRSLPILMGTWISCLLASIFALMINSLLGMSIGILTANLTTITFVLTISHIIFLTFNWLIAVKDKSLDDPVRTAMRMTLNASFWSMLTTVLGFLSFLNVPAKPLREFALSGVVSTLLAFFIAYGIYPSFLRLAKIKEKKNSENTPSGNVLYAFIERNKRAVMASVFIISFIALPGLTMLNVDPSLLSYFSKGSEIYEGLKYIDQNGGSSPMTLVIKTESGEKLNKNKVYKDMWDLQQALEQFPPVGNVISLPVLLAEANSYPLAGLLKWESLIRIMEKKKFGSVGKGFITEDRKQGMFVMRMYETGRTATRLEIVKEVEELVESRGFVPVIVGSVYVMMGEMSVLIEESMIGGLSSLLCIFTLIILIVSRSFKTTFGTVLGIALIIVSILGMIGLYRIPIDMISAPATNVAIGIGIDSMIHMIGTYRRKKKQTGKHDWSAVRDDLWKPVLSSMFVFMTGFSIFLLSVFPPTKRFGGAIVFGTLMAGMIALYVMPAVASLGKRVK